MPLVVLLVPGERNQEILAPETVDALSGLGVTSVSVARDDDGVALVLDGWAFDRQNQEAAVEMIGAPAEGTRALRFVMQMALAARPERG
jgi:hypothetical protein